MEHTQNEYKYNAFISYNREDKKWAELLQRNLDSYKIPQAIKSIFPDVPVTVSPVFRDVTDLDSGLLSEVIEDALSASKYLIVICSPSSSRSIWVNREIEYFVSLGRIEYIIPFIIYGEPNSENPSLECLPPALRNLNENQELLGVNVNDMGRDAAIVKVISRMLRIPFDVFWQRHERIKKIRRRTVIFFLIAFIIFLIVVVSYVNSLNKSLRINHSRFVAERAEELVHEIGTIPCIKMLLEVAPPKYPYTFEVETAIRKIYHQHHQGSCFLINELSGRDDLLDVTLLPKSNGIMLFTKNGVNILDDISLARGNSFYCNIGTSVSWDEDGGEKFCFTSSNDSIYTCELKNSSFKSMNTIGYHEGVNEIRFLKNKDILLSFSDKEVRLWNFKNGKCLATLLLEEGSSNKYAVSESGCLAISSGNGNIIIYDLLQSSPCLIRTISQPNAIVKFVAFIPGTESIVYSTEDNNMYIVHNIDDEPCHFYKSGTGVDYIMPDQNGRYLISVSDKYLRVWDLESMIEMPYSPIDNVGAITTLSSNSDSHTVVTGAFDGKIRLWDLNTGENVVTHSHGKWIHAIDFNDDGERIVSLADDMSIRLWNGLFKFIETADDIEKIVASPLDKSSYQDVISPNGEFSLSVCQDEIHIKRHGKVHTICRGHRGKVNCAAFSSDSKLIVSGGADMTVRVWSVKEGKEICQTLEGHKRPVLNVGFEEDMSYIYSVSSDRTKRKWPFLSYSSLLNSCQQMVSEVELTEDHMRRCYLK